MNLINRNRSSKVVIFSLLLWLLSTTTLFAHGDKFVSQLVNGVGDDGTGFRTKIVITNLGPFETERINNLKIQFFNQDGTFWSIATVAHGNNAEINLQISAHQTVRVETNGAGPLTAGYAIIRNLENTTVFEEDFKVGITVFYEVLKNGNIIDTVSVPLGEPTLAWLFPIEIDVPNNLLTGFAIVNLSDQTNNVTLRLYQELPPRDQQNEAEFDREVQFSLSPNEQRAKFLNDQDLFPEASGPGTRATNGTSMLGMVRGWSDYPVAVLGLLQTPTPTGVQYATLVPSYFDSLRTNTFLYLQEGKPLDADIPVSDYFVDDVTNEQPASILMPWDLIYETGSSSSRGLVPQMGAMLAFIGNKTPEEFDLLSLPGIQGLSYSTSVIDLSNDSENLEIGFAFAIKTNLGRYVKVRIHDVIVSGDFRDLAVEVFVYK